MKDNLVSGVRNKPVRVGQYDARVVEYIPEGNNTGIAEYRSLVLSDFVPVSIPQSGNNDNWKYKPSPWYGAYKPVTTE